MNPIDALFQKLRQEKRKAFIPFVTAGDPDLDTSAEVIRELARCGASLIEIGFPYSDPIADGSVIQASYTRALANPLPMSGILDMVRTLRKEDPFRDGTVPLVSMVSFSLVYNRGPAKFVEQALDAGLSGAIVPDLPVEESHELADIAQKADFKLIQLVTPTTPQDRTIEIARLSTGFLYCVSVVGITGARAELPPELGEQLQWLKSQTDLPLCVGFGISKPEHVHTLKPMADGVIVGSALVKLIEQGKSRDEILRSVHQLSASLIAALN